MFKKCLLCEKDLKRPINKKTGKPNYKVLVIHEITYEEVICPSCLKEEMEKQQIKPKSNYVAKIRFNVPDKIWANRLKGRYSTEWWIAKYGEELGLKKQKEWKDKTSGSLQRYINKFGEVEGKIRYEKFKQRCSIFNEERIDKYGKDHFENTLKNYKNRSKATTLEYFLDKTNGDVEEAKRLLTERQSMTKERYIKKYGEKDGLNRYLDTLYKRTVKFEGHSKVEFEFINDLIEKFPNMDTYYGDNQYTFWTDSRHREETKQMLYKSDLYFKDLNLIIEIYGDFWHMNPSKYSGGDVNNVMNKKAEDIWEKDKKRENFLREKYGVDFIIVWEKDIYKDKKTTLQKVINEINLRMLKASQ